MMSTPKLLYEFRWIILIEVLVLVLAEGSRRWILAHGGNCQ